MEIMICLVDAAAVLFSLFVAGMIRYQSIYSLAFGENLRSLCSVVVVLHVAAFYFMKIYEGFFKRGRYSELLLSIKYNLTLVAGASLLGFGMKSEVFTSRLVMGYFFVLNVIMVWLVHLFIRNKDRIFRFSHKKEINLLLVTTREHLPRILERFGRSKETCWKITGVVLLDEEASEDLLEGIPIISDRGEEYLEFATQNVVDEVFIQVDDMQSREHFLKNMILEFEKMGVVGNLNLDLFDLGLTGEKRIYNLEQYHVVAFSSRLFDYRMVMIKRLVDIIGSLIGILLTIIIGIFLAPILLLE